MMNRKSDTKDHFRHRADACRNEYEVMRVTRRADDCQKRKQRCAVMPYLIELTSPDNERARKASIARRTKPGHHPSTWQACQIQVGNEMLNAKHSTRIGARP